MSKLTKKLTKQCGRFLEPGETIEASVFTSAPGHYTAFLAGGLVGAWINKRVQANRGGVVNGISVEPTGTALLFPGGEMFLSTTSRGDLIVWKRSSLGRYTGIRARVSAGAIQTIESDKRKVKTKVRFIFSDGSALRVNVTGKDVFDEFATSLLRYGVESILV